MFFVNIVVTPSGVNDYSIEVNTNLPEEGLVKKVLEDTLDIWDIRTSEGFDDTPEGDDPWDRTEKSTVPDGYNDYY